MANAKPGEVKSIVLTVMEILAFSTPSAPHRIDTDTHGLQLEAELCRPVLAPEFVPSMFHGSMGDLGTPESIAERHTKDCLPQV